MTTRNTNRIREALKAARFRIWRARTAQMTIQQGLKGILSLGLVGLTSCSLGAPYMRVDIKAYNQDIVAAETDMLLYNIGLLHDHQPPHFMMLSSVSQSRSFSGGGGFQWSQALAALNPLTAIANAVSATKTVTTTTSNLATGNTWQAGPFTAGTAENPTITFVPIQGQEFANRFESPLRDKFILLVNDGNDYNTLAQRKALVMMFADSLILNHGPVSGACRRNEKTDPKHPYQLDPNDSSAWYVNRWPEGNEPEKVEVHQEGSTPDYFYDDFSNCVDEILHSDLDEEQINGHHPVPTQASADPVAADLVTALTANYEWTKKGKDFALKTPVTIPAWFDYTPNFDPQEPPEPDLQKVTLPFEKPTTPSDLVYGTPKGYTVTQDATGGLVIVPDGYGLSHGLYTAGKLEKLGTCETKPDITCNSRKRETGYCEAGNCEPGKCEYNKCEPVECYSSGRCDSDKTRLLYSDKIVNNVWPEQQDFVYVELRRNNDPQLHIADVYNKTAEEACFGSPGDSGQSADDKNKVESPNKLVCGYIKIGNLLQIMQRLASFAGNPNRRQESFFGIGPKAQVPAWVDRKADIGGGRYIWVPAHDPQSHLPGEQGAKERERAEIDRDTFSTLYRLYQLSLVDTSKLVTGAPPVTISK
ncbi:MAG: hypothetical protein WCD12_06135 [Candidatus Binatus sp.]|uniref:hypothetical protein n=1 Tax=Candidatus Binatus sp. TaxID=2811406 RepID=UPI003C72EA0A